MPKTSRTSRRQARRRQSPAKGDHVFLVDGSSYIFRAYHALPPLNRKSDGLQVNAVLGFCNMLWKLLRDMPPDNRPTHLAIVFDKSEVTFRNKLYPDYKAHRPPAPDDLIPQFPLIREAVRAFDLPCLEQGGFEADDLIATYAREAGERGATATIVSSDKDLMQLVTDSVTMYDTMKDRRIGIAEVIEKFGVPPEKVVEVQALAGDSTDNVPGVPGIGIKTAAQLIVEYGDLETLLLRAGEIKQPKRREALIENAEKARISRQLVLLDDKVKLDVPLDELAVHEPDARKLIAFLKAMEFSTLTRRVAEYSQIDPADVDGGRGNKSGSARRPSRPIASEGQSRRQRLRRPVRQPSPASGERARRRRQAGQGREPQGHADLARRRARRSGAQTAGRSQQIPDHPQPRSSSRPGSRACTRPAMSRSTPRPTSIDPMQAEISGIALALAPNDACYIPLAHKQSGDGAGLFDAGLAPDQIKAADALAALRPMLESAGILKIGFNIKFNAVMFAQHGITIRNHDDAQLMSYALDAGRNAHGLDALAERWLGHATLTHGELTGSGKNKLTLRPGRDRPGDRLLGRGRRRDPAAVAGAEAAPGRRAHDDGLRDAGAAADLGAGADGAARHLDRPPGAVAAVGRFRPDRRAGRSRDPGDRRRAGQCRQPQADRRHHVRQDGHCRAAPRPRPARGRPRRRSSTTSPSRAMNFRRRSWSGGRSRN